MTFSPETDGIDHINIYSKGKTELGRRLSNFARTPFRIPFLGNFQSVEGFWYWVETKDECLRMLWGIDAKLRGKSQISTEVMSERLLKIAYRAKLKHHPKLAKELKECTLPLTHYYVYGGKVVTPIQWQWTAELWNEFRNSKDSHEF